MEHFIVIDKRTGEFIGSAAVIEQATILLDQWKTMRPQPKQHYRIVNPEDEDVEIRVYDEPQ